MYYNYVDVYYFLGATDATVGSYYGTRTLSFVANYISCQGFESQLSDCPGFITYQQYAQKCSSTHAAGVKCLREYMFVLSLHCTNVKLLFLTLVL